MPAALDTPSPLSPSGYQETMSQGTMPPLPTGSKTDPYQAARKLALQFDPSLTRHDLDYMVHLMDMEGLSEELYKPEFPKLLKSLVERISGAVGRVVTRAVGISGPVVVEQQPTKPISLQA